MTKEEQYFFRQLEELSQDRNYAASWLFKIYLELYHLKKVSTVIDDTKYTSTFRVKGDLYTFDLETPKDIDLEDVSFLKRYLQIALLNFNEQKDIVQSTLLEVKGLPAKQLRYKKEMLEKLEKILNAFESPMEITGSFKQLDPWL